MRWRRLGSGAGLLRVCWLAAVLGPFTIRAQQLDLQFGDAIPIWLWMDYKNVPGSVGHWERDTSPPRLPPPHHRPTK